MENNLLKNQMQFLLLLATYGCETAILVASVSVFQHCAIDLCFPSLILKLTLLDPNMIISSTPVLSLTLDQTPTVVGSATENTPCLKGKQALIYDLIHVNQGLEDGGNATEGV